jgi:hypothetical protein
MPCSTSGAMMSVVLFGMVAECRSTVECRFTVRRGLQYNAPVISTGILRSFSVVEWSGAHLFPTERSAVKSPCYWREFVEALFKLVL